MGPNERHDISRKIIVKICDNTFEQKSIILIVQMLSLVKITFILYHRERVQLVYLQLRLDAYI